MSRPVDEILAARRQLAAKPRRAGAWLSLVLHAAFVTSVLVAPMMTEADEKPPRFVSVALVSAQALGVADPLPARQEPPRAEPPRVRSPEPDPPSPAVRPRPDARAPKPDKEVARDTDSEAGRQPATDLRRRQGSPTGSSLGTAALGARVGFDNPNFRHSYFVDRLTAMLAAQWRRPALGGDLVTLVHFTIHRDGEVSDVRVVQSSGYSSYDLAALRAVQQAAPFPPLPQSYDQDSLGVTVEFI